VKRIQAEPLEVVRELLQARLVTHCRMRVGRASVRLGGIFAGIAVYVIKFFCFRVIRLQIIVSDRPSGRHAAMVFDFAEIFLAQPKQRRAEEFGVAAHIIIGMRMQLVAVASCHFSLV